jgi:hypothetical protein
VSAGLLELAAASTGESCFWMHAHVHCEEWIYDVLKRVQRLNTHGTCICNKWINDAGNAFGCVRAQYKKWTNNALTRVQIIPMSLLGSEISEHFLFSIRNWNGYENCQQIGFFSLAQAATLLFPLLLCPMGDNKLTNAGFLSSLYFMST